MNITIEADCCAAANMVYAHGGHIGVDATKADAEHIAAFDPPTVLALLDRIESLEARLARVTDDSTALAEVAAERERQIERGYDGDHDDDHGIDHLTGWAQHYVARDTGRAGLVKAAALLVAAIEAHDRAVAVDEPTPVASSTSRSNSQAGSVGAADKQEASDGR